MNNPPILLWFRNDLRINDNPALKRASDLSQKMNSEVLCVFIFEECEKFSTNIGSASKWWLHESLFKFNFELSKLDNNISGISALKIFKGNPETIFSQLIEKLKINTFLWNRRYEPEGLNIDLKIKKLFEKKRFKVETFNASTLVEPWKILGKQNQRLKVFTHYKNTLINNHIVPKPIKKIKHLRIFKKAHDSIDINQIHLRNQKWMSKLKGFWEIGEINALKKLDVFLKFRIKNYNIDRNILFDNGTSLLSPHIHFGEISSKLIWHRVLSKSPVAQDEGEKAFLSEIIWREFAINLLLLFPNLDKKNIKPTFNNFNWLYDKNNFEKWKFGKTGYPVVDAAMNQLWDTGWMHNRARMIVASFLTKHLLIPWQWGANWFHDTLVDADMASNYASWQWVAGCGADAAPYFRIFNPTIQGKKFDKFGLYVKKYVKSLSILDKKTIHEPHKSKLNVKYPRRIVEHNFARQRALTNFAHLKKNL